MAKKELVNEHLIYILKNTTPYQRMVWLKKVFDFWKGRNKIVSNKAKNIDIKNLLTETFLRSISLRVAENGPVPVFLFV